MNKPGTFNEIDGLITHLIDKNLTDDETLLSKIYADLGMTAGCVFKIRFEKRTNKTVPDPFGSYFPTNITPTNVAVINDETNLKVTLYSYFQYICKTIKNIYYGFFGK
jgi:hypothetical protein